MSSDRASDKALITRLEAVATEYLLQRYGGPGNPMGTEIRRVEGAVATKVSFAPGNRMMNTVHHLEDPAALEPLLTFYGATGQPCWIELSPARANGDVARAVIDAGFRPELYRALLFAAVPDLVLPAGSDDGIEVRRVGRSDLDTFLDVMNLGFGTPEALLAMLRRNQSFWADVPTWRLYLGSVDGTPSGAAVLSLHERDGEKIGYLAAAATLEGARGRGLHRAMLAARLRDAAQAGCGLVTGQADFGSISQRNQQRAGLAIGTVITVWGRGR